MTGHELRTERVEDGWVACCSCGWRGGLRYAPGDARSAEAAHAALVEMRTVLDVAAAQAPPPAGRRGAAIVPQGAPA